MKIIVEKSSKCETNYKMPDEVYDIVILIILNFQNLLNRTPTMEEIRKVLIDNNMELISDQIIKEIK